MSESAAPPAGWYADPRNPAQQRYWDGTAWTAHVAPAAAPAASVPAAPGGFPPQPQKRGLSTGAIVGIVVGGIVVLGIIVAGILAAMAAPVFNAQQAKAYDTAARADVSTLGMEISVYFVDNSGPPPRIVVEDGMYQFEGGDPYFSGAPVSEGVELGGVTGSSPTQWCVWVTAPGGDLKDFEYSSERALQEGRCGG